MQNASWGMAGQALGKALAMHDQAALEKLWSPQMIVNGPNNAVLTRAEIFEGMKKGRLDYETDYKTRSRRSSSSAMSPSLWAKIAILPPLAQRKASCFIAALPTYSSTSTATG